MTTTTDRPRRIWLMWIWSLQLVPSGAAAMLAGFVITTKGEASPSALLIGLFATAWFLLSAGVLASRAGRQFIVARPAEWGLSLGVLALSLAVSDFFLTLSGLVPTIEQVRNRSLEYTYHRYSGYRLVPKSVVVGAQSIRINSRGFRGPEIERPKPSGRKTIVFLGGSQVFDYHGGDWPAQAGSILRERGHDVEVVNGGVPGYNSTDSLTAFATDLWTLQPEFVVVCHGWNDIKYFARMSGSQPYRGLPPSASLTMHRDWRLHPQGLDDILSRSAYYRKARASLVDLFVTAEGRDLWEFPSVEGSDSFDETGPRQFELNLRLLVTLIDAVGARAILCQQAMLPLGRSAIGIDAETYASRNLGLNRQERERALGLVHRTVDEVASATGAIVIDMRAEMSGHPAYFRDAIHFSPVGSRAAAQMAADKIEQLLRSPADSPN